MTTTREEEIRRALREGGATLTSDFRVTICPPNDPPKEPTATLGAAEPTHGISTWGGFGQNRELAPMKQVVSTGKVKPKY